MRLREVRTEKGYSRHKLSVESGVAEQTLQHIEEQTANPTVETLYRIADTLKCDIKELF